MSEPWQPFGGALQMCTIGDLIENEECHRLAQWVWRPEPDNHPIYLCNYHAEPFTASQLPVVTP